MKRKHLLALILPLLLTSCNSGDYISFKDYIDIVKTQEENQRDIFIFTSSACSHCQTIKPLIKKVIQNQQEYDFNLYELTVDQNRKMSDKVPFSDSTMGYLTGDSSNDGLKLLDNRIAKFVDETKPDASLVYQSTTGKYMYIMTPLVIWYEGGIEVKVVNSVQPQIKKDDKGNITYDAFLEFLTFPEEKVNWNEKFDLNSF